MQTWNISNHSCLSDFKFLHLVRNFVMYPRACKPSSGEHFIPLYLLCVTACIFGLRIFLCKQQQSISDQVGLKKSCTIEMLTAVCYPYSLQPQTLWLCQFVCMTAIMNSSKNLSVQRNKCKGKKKKIAAWNLISSILYEELCTLCRFLHAILLMMDR